MFRRTWNRSGHGRQKGRDATLADVIETIDRTAPGTKAELAEEVGVSEQYLSELLQELKTDDIVRKAYVVDDDQVYDSAPFVSSLVATPDTDADDSPAVPDSGDSRHERGGEVLDLLARLNEVTRKQYDAAHAAFVDEEPAQSADALESLANERYSAVVSELKSYTLTTDWPGNRVAADLSTVATNLEIVGDRACFVDDVIRREERGANGVVEERVESVFAAGAAINDQFAAVLFDCDLDRYETLLSLEETIHRDLDELFELVTAYDTDVYGYLVTVTRALERAIYYWVDAAELAVRLHSGVTPDHVRD
jgi:DNA-binding Lrp family transcriptional regulator